MKPHTPSNPPAPSSHPLPANVRTSASQPSTVTLNCTDYESFTVERLRFHIRENPLSESDQNSGSARSEVSVDRAYFLSVDLAVLQRLAAGETVSMEHPSHPSPVSGRMLMFWWGAPESQDEWRGRSLTPFLEFLPDSSPAEGCAFDEWCDLRFPGMLQFVGRFEAPYLFLFERWCIESSLPDQLQPDDSLLYTAVVENYERLVNMILEGRTIALDPARTTEITETALGIAMENTGEFGAGPGLMSGCHRLFREDDFTMAEDAVTWIPRAERIGESLRRAGAIDYSPLLKASGSGELNQVCSLLDDGFPPNFAIYGHTTPLLEAVATNNAPLCRLLLDRGANPNLRRPFESSMSWGGSIYPLQYALDQPEIFSLLLSAGADPSNCFDNSNQTPVVFWGGYKSEENAATIFGQVDFGSIRNPYGMTGVHLLNAEDLVLCHKFIPKDLLDLADCRGQTPLVLAIVNGQYAKAEVLLSMGASPIKPSWMIEMASYESRALYEYLPCLITPAQAALMSGNLDILTRLIEAAPDPDATIYHIDCSGNFPGEVLRDLWRRFQEDADHAPSSVDGLHLGGLASAFEKELRAFLKIPLRLPHEVNLLKHSFPELVLESSILDIAATAEVGPHLLATWKAGRIGAREWLNLVDEALSEAAEAAAEFDSELAMYDPSSKNEDEAAPCYRRLLNAIDRAGEFLDRARAAISECAPTGRTLSADICAVASGEFEGGSARARKNVALDEGVEFDDFLDALRESFEPGSTTDLGKLLQAARSTIAQLDAESVELMRNLSK